MSNHRIRSWIANALTIYPYSLGGITQAISQDKALRAALAKRDRAELLKLATPIFATLSKEYDITHLYFIDADRKVLLRVHSPEEYGDVIDRVTTMAALSSRAPAHGVEQGASGMPTLRYAYPLYEDKAKQHLIGLIEMGIDIGHIMEDIQKSLNVRIFEGLSKKYLRRDKWEREVAHSGRAAAWGAFPDEVPSGETVQSVSPAFWPIVSQGIYRPLGAIDAVQLGKSNYRMTSFPILDIGGKMVGRVIMLVDVTAEVLNVRYALYTGMAMGMIGCSFLFALFWWLTGKVGGLIEQNQQALHDLATRDGLTGLFNHITFYTILEDEVARSKRYGTPVSLLMMDLDRFKSINDKYGHVAGDMVLKEFGEIVNRQSRHIDKICRYGGEEVAVILPGLNAHDAAITAERLRSVVEGHRFKVGKETELTITVSIGAAAIPEHASSAQELVDVADKALYAAKERGRNQVRIYNIARLLAKGEH